MNEVLKQLSDRKSVRVFNDKEIPKEVKSAIIGAATEAPTAGNQQLYTILDITDKSIKEKLAVSCDNQPFIATAPMVLIFLADCKKWYDAFLKCGAEPRKPRAGDLFLALSDANIAAQNAVMAAHSLGLGSCYIGDIMENCEEHRKLLNLPRYVFPAAMLVFGYPDESQIKRKKPERADIKHILHENSYREMDEKELFELFSKKTSNDYNEWMKAFCKRKYNSEFSIEMSRSVEKYLEDFKC